MIAAVIRSSLRNRFLVLIAALMMAAWGIWALARTPVDALPDLSDVQVIVRVAWPGKAPQVIEDQVTYPLTTTMLSVPGAKTVRGFPCLAKPTSTYCLTRGPIPTGRAHGWWNI